MTISLRLEAMLARFPIAATIVYGALVAAFVFTTVTTVTDLLERREAVAAAADLLSRIEGRGVARTATVPTDVTVPVGSPFVEGATVSVAGATLLQRVAAATMQVGGNILSSQVDLLGSQSKAGFVTVTASLEVELTSLQRLLYDLESGMPFLFVDQMIVQTSETSASAAGGKMRVLLSVSGQWRGDK